MEVNFRKLNKKSKTSVMLAQFHSNTLKIKLKNETQWKLKLCIKFWSLLPNTNRPFLKDWVNFICTTFLSRHSMAVFSCCIFYLWHEGKFKYEKPRGCLFLSGWLHVQQSVWTFLHLIIWYNKNNSQHISTIHCIFTLLNLLN